MKNILLISTLLIAGTAHADWRMERFDLNLDGFVTADELSLSGCTVKQGLYNSADKNNDGKLSKGELRKATEYIIRNRCPKPKRG